MPWSERPFPRVAKGREEEEGGGDPRALGILTAFLWWVDTHLRLTDKGNVGSKILPEARSDSGGLWLLLWGEGALPGNHLGRPSTTPKPLGDPGEGKPSRRSPSHPCVSSLAPPAGSGPQTTATAPAEPEESTSSRIEVSATP